MRIVVIGDIGVVDGMMHIGDEAMFEALVQELSGRGAQVVAVSSAPSESASRYGVPAVARIGFDGLSREDSESRLAVVTAAARGAATLPASDPAAAVIDAVAASDGVVLAGGGNLASPWPVHVYERAALAEIARSIGRPVVVTGQTLGPDLRGRDRELVAELLRSAALVGVRERASQALAHELGVDARLGVDDASFLGLDPSASASAATATAPERRGVLVSLSLHLGGRPRAETVAGIARLADAAAQEVGGPVLFHAHFGAADSATARGDAILHDEVRAQLRAPALVLPTGDAAAAAATARSAGLLITGRYHPAVFAAPAGVTVLGLVTDRYTAVKQRGVLAHWGQDATVAIDHADTEGIARLHTLVAQRDPISAVAAERYPAHRREAAAWWDRVAATFSP